MGTVYSLAIRIIMVTSCVVSGKQTTSGELDKCMDSSWLCLNSSVSFCVTLSFPSFSINKSMYITFSPDVKMVYLSVSLYIILLYFLSILYIFFLLFCYIIDIK